MLATFLDQNEKPFLACFSLPEQLFYVKSNYRVNLLDWVGIVFDLVFLPKSYD